MAVSRRIILAVGLLVVMGIFLFGTTEESVRANTGGKVFLPVVMYNYPEVSAFGVETECCAIVSPLVSAQAEQLGVKWLRLNTVSWRDVQPNEGDPYNWSALSAFESELAAANRSNLTPIVIVDDSPDWATINVPYPTSCGAIRQDHFAHFGAFMAALAERYSAPPYNVHYWELGNEPDVDPRLVPPNSIYGCWGHMEDPFYGGRHYGEMLKVVTPRIRQADPLARVLTGGLLLAQPNSPVNGRPELFLQGILEAGAAPYFDIVSYHGYSNYRGSPLDDYSAAGGTWAAYGGIVKGKPAFLHELMRKYGVSKPLFLTESGLTCDKRQPVCANPDQTFFEAQGDYVARTYARTLHSKVDVLIWYTLDGPGWNNVSLLDASVQPRPAYTAYQQLIKQLKGADVRRPALVDYGAGVEAYRFTKGDRVVDIVWSLDTTPRAVSVPQANVIAAYSRDGVPIAPAAGNGNAVFTVGFSPIYIERHP